MNVFLTSSILRLLLVLSTVSGPIAPGPRPERIVFLGDSITAEADQKGGYLSQIRTSLRRRCPKECIEIVGAGIAGNRVRDLQERLERDVFWRHPTWVVIYIGINDVWYGEFDPSQGTSPEQFEAGLTDLIQRIQKHGAKVLLCTPSVIGEKKNGANQLDWRLDLFAQIVRKVGSRQQVPVCDLRQAFCSYIQAHNPKDLEDQILTSDRVHLNEVGNQVVADTILPFLIPKRRGTTD